MSDKATTSAPENSSEQSLRTKTAANVGWTAFWQIAGRGLAYFIGKIVLARLLKPADFGTIGIAHALTGIFGRVGDLGVGQAIVQRRDDVERAYETGFVLRAIVLVACTLLVAAIAPFYARFFDAPGLAPIIWVMVTPFLFGAFFFVPGVRLYRDLKHGHTAFSYFVGEFSLLIVTVVLAAMGYGVWSIVWGGIAGTLANWTALFLFSPWKPRFRYDPKLAKELIQFGKFVLLSQVLVYGIQVIDKLLIGKILGLTALGYYVYAYSIGTWVTTEIADLISRALTPAMAHRKGNIAALRKGFESSVRATMSIVLPICIGIMLTAEEVSLGLFGPDWADVEDPLRVLSVLGIILSLERTGEPVLLAFDSPSTITRGRLGMLLAMGLSVIPCALAWGIIGAAGAVTVSGLVATMVVVPAACKRLEIPWRHLFSEIARPTLAALSMALCVYIAQRFWINQTELGPLFRLGIAMSVGTLAYAIAALVFLPHVIREFTEIIREVLKR